MNAMLSSPVSAVDALNALGVTPSRRPVKESAIIDDVLEEDDSFAYAPTPPRPSALPSRPSAHLAHPHEDSDEELEEDMSFMAPHAHEHHPLTSESVTTHTPALTDDVEDDDMDFAEDPAFTTAAQASTSTQLHPRSAFVTDGDDDDESEGLPSVSQLIRNGAGKRSIDVSNLDLGSRYNQHMLLSGTTYSGKKMRFRRQRGNALVGETPEDDDKDPNELGKLAMSLLSMPIHRLTEKIEKQLVEKALREADAAPQRNHNAAWKSAAKGKGKERPDIWTDRYRPKTFTDLLGDERMHRQAMSWLKEWDSCVFKSAPPKKKTLKRSAPTTSTSMFGQNKENQDPLKRPLDKVLLLTGPPGLGKTTLAHVIATQAGYQVVEVNASDDRSGTVVHDKIRNSLESRALTNLGSLSSSKPTCLVIDEIDGATGGGASGFVRSLIKLIVDGSRTSPYKNSKKKDAQPLVRPIICICNDLYAPVLRPLRQMARIVRFQPPTTAHLSKRLRDICDLEGMKADSKSLTTLIEASDGDIRNCLNTLQIIRRQTDNLDVRIIKQTALGLKDTSTSVLATWDKLFKIPAKKRLKGIEESTDGKYINNLLRDISTCGEYDKLALTCFESYLKGKSPADGLRAIEKGLDWLAFYDRLDGRLRSEQDYSVMPYIPYAFVAWNPLFAAVTNKTPEWPKTDYDMFVQRSSQEEIAQAVRSNLPPHLRASFTMTSIAVELAPLLARIISPDLKPVNQQLVKGEDRLTLKKLLRVMSDFNLNFVQDRNEEGQIIYTLEPRLETFAYFEGKRPADIPPPRFNLRQLISKELEAEAMRKASGTEGDGTENAKTVGSIMNAYRKADEHAKPGKEAAALDFFGRPVVVKALAAPTLEGDKQAFDAPVEPVAKRPRVSYKFHEGFSNAVRVNVKVLELFQS